MRKIIEHTTYECSLCHKMFDTREKAERCIHYPVEDFKIVGGEYASGDVLPVMLEVKAPNGLTYMYKIDIESMPIW